MSAREAPVLRGGGRAALLLALFGALAFAGVVFGFLRAPERAFHAYLAGYAFALSIVLGCVAFVMISHAANATWPVAVRRLPESLGAALPALAVLFVPVQFGVRKLYPWAHAAAYPEPLRELLVHRSVFMNPTAFGLRAFAYLALWSALALLLRHYSLAMDRGADPERCSRALRRISYAGLPLAALTSGFAAYEWFMSVSPEFVSSMFAALWIAMCLHGGVAAVVVLAALAARQLEPSASHTYALGRLLLAFLVFLGYTAFFQFLLVWMANRPQEAIWYLERWRGGYRWTAYTLIFGEFTLPFFALLSYRLKRSLRSLAPIALMCLAALYVHANWLIMPEAVGGAAWLEPVALVAVLAPTLAVALLVQRGQPLAAAADPRYSDALAYVSD